MSKKIFYSSSIFTSDSMEPIDGAVVIDGENILYVGDRKGAEAYLDGAVTEDLGSKTIAPRID